MSERKVSVLNVAEYILEKMGEMTTMKLQKLVYYCQAWSLAWEEKPLFDEEFEAWANGPVCPELFRIHKGKFVIDKSDLAKYADCDFAPDEIETMDKVIEYYGNQNSVWLSNLTHQEDPWKFARVNVPPGARCSNTISKDSMQQYYGGL
ncbi:MAG: DUF4065 domain-containing protein [Clostridia bacterium]|nr:DUF4065 domain-containing protein [Clostridia bacterium]